MVDPGSGEFVDNKDPGQQCDPHAGAGSSPNSVRQNSDYTDGRAPGQWESMYPLAARQCMRSEAALLTVFLIFWSSFCGVSLALSDERVQFPLLDLTTCATPPPLFTLDFRWTAIFAAGGLGGTVFSIKWLIHSVAKRKWHLDRRYWRLFVPLLCRQLKQELIHQKGARG